MLERARRAWAAPGPVERTGEGSLVCIEADLTLHRDDERFGLVILALNSFMLLDDEATRVAALVTMRSHLRADGVAVVDVVTPDDDELASYDGRLQLEWIREDPERDEVVAKLMSAWLDADGRTVRLAQLFDASPRAGGAVRRVTREDLLHLVTAAELRRHAARAGFGRTELRGDHRLRPHGTGSARAILIGRAL
jgi:hypothetical protein